MIEPFVILDRDGEEYVAPHLNVEEPIEAPNTPPDDPLNRARLVLVIGAITLAVVLGVRVVAR